MAAESLKEYLVKLGWEVDELGLSKATAQIGKFEGKISGMGSAIVKNFAGATVAVASFLTTSIASMVKLLDVTAQADLSVERFARKMWTTEESARSFMSALNAMEADYSDIFYMTPEEYKRFMDLRDLGNSIKAPEGLQEGLKLVRDIRGEFSKLKVIVEYSTQWVSYYLTKYLKKDMEEIKQGLSDFNEWVKKNIPQITEKIAKFFIMTYKLGKSVVIMVKGLAESFGKFFDMLSPKSKAAGAAILGFVGMLAMGPIGVFIAGLLALLLVIDDIQTWMRGGKSAWGEAWDKLSTMFSDMDTSGLDRLDGRMDELLSSLHDVGGALGDLGLGVLDFLDDVGVLDLFFDAAIGAIDILTIGLQTILDLILLITGNFEKMSENSIFRKLIKVEDPDDPSKGWSVGFMPEPKDGGKTNTRDTENSNFGSNENKKGKAPGVFNPTAGKNPEKEDSAVSPYHDSVVSPAPNTTVISPVFTAPKIEVVNKSPYTKERYEENRTDTLDIMNRLFNLFSGEEGKETVQSQYKTFGGMEVGRAGGSREDYLSERESKGSKRNMTNNQTNNINVYGTSEEAASKTAKKIIDMRNQFSPIG